jgi:hypothetical protein
VQDLGSWLLSRRSGSRPGAAGVGAGGAQAAATLIHESQAVCAICSLEGVARLLARGSCCGGEGGTGELYTDGGWPRGELRGLVTYVSANCLKRKKIMCLCKLTCALTSAF